MTERLSPPPTPPRRRPRASALALALGVAALAGGCGDRQTAPRRRTWTLADLEVNFDMGKYVAAGGTLAPGMPPSYFISAGTRGNVHELTINRGFIEGRPARYATTEVWTGFDQVWVQPVYLATRDGKVIQDAPWVFGIGPDSLFYSPFWQVFTYELPADMATATAIDVRGVLDVARATGGVRAREARIISLATGSVGASTADDTPAEVHYAANNGAWDATAGQRYIDFGPGRFTFGADGVVREIPIFMFVSRSAGAFVPYAGGAFNVGGTRPLFSAPPVLAAPPAGTGGTSGTDPAAPLPVDLLQPTFGGLWRLHLVEITDQLGASVTDDGRIVVNGKVLDSQAAIEALGADFIHRTELLVACPLMQLGDVPFGAGAPPL